eukprot:4631994-Alexandrium_andersonii.AAC.1
MWPLVELPTIIAAAGFDGVSLPGWDSHVHQVAARLQATRQVRAPLEEFDSVTTWLRGAMDDSTPISASDRQLVA